MYVLWKFQILFQGIYGVVAFTQPRSWEDCLEFLWRGCSSIGVFFKFFWGPAKQSLKNRQHSDPKNYGLNGFQQTIKEKLATMWMNDMPEAALEIVRTHRLQPAVELVKLDSAITRPSFQDHFFGGISNEVWTYWCVIQWKAKNPPKLTSLFSVVSEATNKLKKTCAQYPPSRKSPRTTHGLEQCASFSRTRWPCIFIPKAWNEHDLSALGVDWFKHKVQPFKKNEQCQNGFYMGD